MTTFDRAVFSNANDVVPPQASFVDTRRRDPDIAIRVANGKIASGGGRHPVAIDAIHQLHEFVARMEELRSLIHNSLKAHHRGLAQDWIVDEARFTQRFRRIAVSYLRTHSSHSAPAGTPRVSQ